MIKLLILDLDGVIFDTERNMIKSWNEVRKKHGISKKFEDYRKNIGLPFFKILENLNIKKNKKKIQKTYKHYSIKNNDKIKLFPKVKSTLNKLKKVYLLAVVTSKDYDRTIKLIKKYKLPLKYISCPKKNLRGKPFPDQINYIMKKINFKNRSEVAYVGDTKYDYMSAKKAKVNFIHASYGFEKKIKGLKTSINNFFELIDYLNERK